MTPPRHAALTLVVAGVLCVTGLIGCRAANNLDEEYVSAHFVLGTSVADRNAVGRACAAPHVVPQVVPDSPDSAAARLDLVRFRVDDATSQELQRLYDCLRGFPSVTTVGAPTGPSGP